MGSDALACIRVRGGREAFVIDRGIINVHLVCGIFEDLAIVGVVFEVGLDGNSQSLFHVIQVEGGPWICWCTEQVHCSPDHY